jgi:hypothetical protein
MRIPLVVAASLLAAVALLPREARAAEIGYESPGRRIADNPLSAEGLVGSGLGGNYGMAYGGRLGWTFPSGVYLGGDVTHYDGVGAPSQLLLGGDVGYRIFTSNDFELRPFSLIGAAIPEGGGGRSQFALQPGLLAAYHFGRAFISGEGRLQAMPSPTAASLLAGAGLSF